MDEATQVNKVMNGEEIEIKTLPESPKQNSRAMKKQKNLPRKLKEKSNLGSPIKPVEEVNKPQEKLQEKLQEKPQKKKQQKATVKKKKVIKKQDSSQCIIDNVCELSNKAIT